MDPKPMKITSLGEARFPSPSGSRAVSDDLSLPDEVIRGKRGEGLAFEMAGPRPMLYFDPAKTRAGVVTCGGLCPGLNNVIRSLYLELHHCYDVKEVIGFRGGYQGLDPEVGAEPMVLTSERVDKIHRQGGTILGTSRGPVDIKKAVDNLIRLGINILFTIGGDGTQRGSNALYLEASSRGYPLSVVGIPKTVDNDIAFTSRTFGFLTAVQEAAVVLDHAHIEARSVHNGVALVKLMGRHAGFIAVGATIASQDVNFTLVPEVPFRLEGEGGFLRALEERVKQRAHAVVVVAEGAGQDLFAGDGGARDASGNARLHDIGLHLRERIEAHFSQAGIPMVMRYFDPSYIVRSAPANAEDSMLCDLLARNAVHAAMAGKTGLVIGYLHNHFVHIPIELLASRKKSVDPEGMPWRAALAATGQPARFE